MFQGYSLVVCTVDAPASDSIRKHMKLLDARKTGGILLGLSDSRLIEKQPHSIILIFLDFLVLCFQCVQYISAGL